MGEIVTKIDEALDLTIQTVSGEITAIEIIQKMEDYYKGKITRLLLWDFRDAKLDKISASDVRMISHLSQKYIIRKTNGKTAMVFSSDLGFGFGRMYDNTQIVGDAEVTNNSFRDMDSALEWLGIS